MADTIYTEPREAEWNGGVYVIRDVWAKDGGKKRFITCEYAVESGAGIVWRPCPEAVRYADIEPLRQA